MSDYAMYGAQVRYELVAGQQAEARAAAAADGRARALCRAQELSQERPRTSVSRIGLAARTRGLDGQERQWPGLGRWIRAWRAAISSVEAPREQRRPAHDRPTRDAAAPPAA